MAKPITFTPTWQDCKRVMGTRQHPSGAGGRLPALDPPATFREHDVAWVWAFGRLRRGIVTNVARVNVTVAWVSPSNLTQVRTTKARAEYVYPDRRASESGCS